MTLPTAPPSTTGRAELWIALELAGDAPAVVDAGAVMLADDEAVEELGLEAAMLLADETVELDSGVDADELV